MCLRKGFQKEMPLSDVSSARNINELVSEKIPVELTRTETKTVKKVDENGLVTEERITTQIPYQDTRLVKGICLGSEYILK